MLKQHLVKVLLLCLAALALIWLFNHGNVYSNSPVKAVHTIHYKVDKAAPPQKEKLHERAKHDAAPSVRHAPHRPANVGRDSGFHVAPDPQYDSSDIPGSLGSHGSWH